MGLRVGVFDISHIDCRYINTLIDIDKVILENINKVILGNWDKNSFLDA